MAKKNNFKKNKKNKKNNKNNKQFQIEESIKNEKCLEESLHRIKNNKKCIKAKEYLDLFENSKDHWKFNKMLQVFILNYICIRDIFPKEYFNIFKNYLKKMNDKTKKVL